MAILRDRKVCLNLAVAAGLAALAPSMAHAVAYTWDGNSGIDLNWHTPNNWTSNDTTIPDDSTDTVTFNSSSPQPTVVNFTADAVAGQIGVSTTGRDVRFDLNGFTLDVQGTGTQIWEHGASSSNTVEFRGNGTSTEAPGAHGGIAQFAGLIEASRNSGQTILSGNPVQYITVLVSQGADLNTTGLSLADYRSPGDLTITGAGSRLNNAGAAFQMNRGANANYVSKTPRAELQILDGGVLNHDGTTFGFNIVGSTTNISTARILVDGDGSQLNFNVNSDNIDRANWGGNDRIVNLDITNGGLMNFATALPTKVNNLGTGYVAYNISGDGSKVTSNQASVGGWSVGNTTAARIGATYVKVGEGSIFEARGKDGSADERAIAIFDTSILSVEGGDVNMTAAGNKNLIVRSITTGKSRLQGFGTINGGGIKAEVDSIVAPGDTLVNNVVTPGVGTLRSTGGNFTSAGGTPGVATDLLWDLQTTAGNPHDLLALSNVAGIATIGDNSTNGITFAVLGGGNLASGGVGFMDFLIASDVLYGGTVLGDNVPDVDNLDDLMATAGYTRVDASQAPGTGEYRYFLTTVGSGDYAASEFAGLEALRLEMAPIPEPTSLALLGLSAMGLMARRRRLA